MATAHLAWPATGYVQMPARSAYIAQAPAQVTAPVMAPGSGERLVSSSQPRRQEVFAVARGPCEGSVSAVQVRPAGQPSGHTAAVFAEACSSSVGGHLANGLSRNNTGENLLNYFNSGSRRKVIEAPTQASFPSAEKRQRHVVKPPETSLLPEALDASIDLKPSMQQQGWAPHTGVKRYGEPQHRGPNPMELPAEQGSRRRMHHVVEAAESASAAASASASPRFPGDSSPSVRLEEDRPLEIWPGADTPSSGSRQAGSLKLRPAGVSSVPSPRMLSGRSSFTPRCTPRENLESLRDEARKRELSADAAHRRSVGVWTCLDSGLSDNEAYSRAHAQLQDTPRQRRRSLLQRSQGVSRALQDKVGPRNPADEDVSGEELGGSRSRRPSQKRHIDVAGDGGGSLANGLTTVPSEDCLKVALGTKQKGRQNNGAQDYCLGGPGPWDQLPDTTLPVKDGWGRFSPRLRDPPKEIKGTAADDKAVPFATETNALPSPRAPQRMSSAPLPYGSQEDVPEPSQPPREGIPLGLTLPPPSALMLGYYDGGSGGSGGPGPKDMAAPEAAASSGGAPIAALEAHDSEEPGLDALPEFAEAEAVSALGASRRNVRAGQAAYLSPRQQPRKIPFFSASAAEDKVGSLTLSAGSNHRQPRRSLSQGPERPALMSSSFVERQRETTPQRGGIRRLSAGGVHFTSPRSTGAGRDSLYPRVRVPSSSPMRGGIRNHMRANLSQSQGLGSFSLPSDKVLDEVCNKHLGSLKEEIEQLQSKSMNLDSQIRKAQMECSMLKCRSPTPVATPAMSPVGHSPQWGTPRVPMTPPVASTPPCSGHLEPF
eukprot:TRINITY_DN5135_c0_g1_i1.p1 TRINITY_DN5135_c0_g1~~TRINITY_DN5135_c0_g1_i1.p1  ORF type:complete len:850 (-),score=143.60 TRINITY_DN5135_c0_g1_i1:145-2622(-)